MVPGIKAVPIPAHDSIRLHVDRQFYRPLDGSQKKDPFNPKSNDTRQDRADLETVNWTHPQLDRTPLTITLLSERDKSTTPCGHLSLRYYIHEIQRPMCRCNSEINNTNGTYRKCCPSYRTHPFRVPEFTADTDWDDE
jgi:hypothetical protein